MSKLQEKPSAIKRTFSISDRDPWTQLNPDPVQIRIHITDKKSPKSLNAFEFFYPSTKQSLTFLSTSGSKLAGPIRPRRTVSIILDGRPGTAGGGKLLGRPMRAVRRAVQSADKRRRSPSASSSSIFSLTGSKEFERLSIYVKIQQTFTVFFFDKQRTWVF
jgi:hypothetical protein